MKESAPMKGADFIWKKSKNPQIFIFKIFDGLYVCGASVKGETYKTQPLTLVLPPYDSYADLICHDLGTTSDLLSDKFDDISGGGMWQLAFSGMNGIPEKIDEMFFSGVCVSGIPGKCLYSRGPSTLYDIFLKYLDTFYHEGN